MTVRAIVKLEREANIPVLRQLYPKLHILKNKARFHLHPITEHRGVKNDYCYENSKTVEYFLNWTSERDPNCTLPTWKNLFKFLRELNLSDLAKTIECYLMKTAQQQGMLSMFVVYH